MSDCVSTFVNLGIVVTREDIALEPSFWAQLPGNFSYIARRSLISNKNFASFSSLHNFPVGRASDNHWGDAITRLETTSGTTVAIESGQDVSSAAQVALENSIAIPPTIHVDQGKRIKVFVSKDLDFSTIETSSSANSSER